MASPEDEATARTEGLLRDAEETLQQERMAEFWRQWGTTLMGMALMLVIGTGAGVVWREWRGAKNQTATTTLINIVTSKDPVIGPEVAKLGGNHAAIAYLSKAGVLAANMGAEGPSADLAKLYAATAKAGDNTVWGWLGRWNTLRLRMDDDKADAAKLLADYEALAHDKKGQQLSALALTDAAIIAGERLKDPVRALGYIAQAEKVVSSTTPMSSTVSDLKHLYQIRAQTTAQTTPQTTNEVKAQ